MKIPVAANRGGVPVSYVRRPHDSRRTSCSTRPPGMQPSISMSTLRRSRTRLTRVWRSGFEPPRPQAEPVGACRTSSGRRRRAPCPRIRGHRVQAPEARRGRRAYSAEAPDRQLGLAVEIDEATLAGLAAAASAVASPRAWRLGYTKHDAGSRRAFPSACRPESPRARQRMGHAYAEPAPVALLGRGPPRAQSQDFASVAEPRTARWRRFCRGYARAWPAPRLAGAEWLITDRTAPRASSSTTARQLLRAVKTLLGRSHEVRRHGWRVLIKADALWRNAGGVRSTTSSPARSRPRAGNGARQATVLAFVGVAELIADPVDRNSSSKTTLTRHSCHAVRHERRAAAGTTGPVTDGEDCSVGPGRLRFLSRRLSLPDWTAGTVFVELSPLQAHLHF